MFPLVAEAVATVQPVETLGYVSCGHIESDESGAMNVWLAAALRCRSPTTAWAVTSRSTTCAIVRRSRSPTVRLQAAFHKLAELALRTIAIMHGTSFEGDGRQAFLDLARGYAEFAAA
jgi:hypothetical protein